MVYFTWRYFFKKRVRDSYFSVSLLRSIRNPPLLILILLDLENTHRKYPFHELLVRWDVTFRNKKIKYLLIWNRVFLNFWTGFSVWVIHRLVLLSCVPKDLIMIIIKLQIPTIWCRRLEILLFQLPRVKTTSLSFCNCFQNWNSVSRDPSQDLNTVPSLMNF